MFMSIILNSSLTHGIRSSLIKFGRNIGQQASMICFYDSFQLPDKAVFFPLSILNRKQRRHCDRILFARVCNFSYFDKVICYRGMFVGFFAIHKLLDIFYSCVKSNVFILIMVRSAKVTAIVVKTCVMSHIDANLLLIVGSIPIINYIKINY